MSSEYADLTRQWEAMTVDRRFQVIANMWPCLPAALQVALLGFVHAVLGALPNSESPESANTD